MMKDNVVYNKFDNQVMVKTDGDLIYIICHKEEQQDNIVKRMTTDNCLLELRLKHLNPFFFSTSSSACITPEIAIKPNRLRSLIIFFIISVYPRIFK